MKNIKTFEIFGFSKKEKIEKEKTIKLQQLKDEVFGYNWVRLTTQPSKKDPDIKGGIKIRLYQAQGELPILYKLLPSLWDNKGATSCLVELDDDTQYQCVIPSAFYFVIDSSTNVVSDDTETKQRAFDYLKNKL